MKLNSRIIKALFEAKISSSINESYATVKERFIRDGADKAEVKSLLDLHKKLKDMRRLKDNEINIDSFAKGKSFNKFKSLMKRYSEKDTETKTDKFNELKNNIITENDEWLVYKINTAEEAYLFHGLTKWCIVSGSKSSAEKYFNKYGFDENSNFYFIVRKNPTGDQWDYIALQLQKDGKTYWDKNDDDYESLPRNLNIPKLSVKYKPLTKPIPKTWKLSNDGSYDVEGDVNLKNFEHFISKGKLTVKFNKVSGAFICINLNLTSLDGCPKEVGEMFNCADNKLASLKGCPEKVGTFFICSNNNLTSLEGCPKEIKGWFNCQKNKLSSLKGCPEKIGGNFNCSGNKLTSLEGAPAKVGGNFNCSDNKLTSLKGAPKKVGGSFDCYYNQLTSLEGCPKEVGRDFDCSGNTKKFTESDVEKLCKVKYIHV